MRVPALLLVLAALPLASCATLADAAKGDTDLPNAGAGPFRAVKKGELGLSLVAPNAVDDGTTLTRDAAILDVDGDPATFEIAGYFAASASGAAIDAPPVAIRRGTSADGRSFERKTAVVLEVTEPWEEGTIGAPSVVATSGEIRLYYASGGGVGLARSADGVAFTKEPAPIFEAAASGWDAGALPASPSVIALPGGGFALFYEVALPDGAHAIGEARSTDGLAWTRTGVGPVLSPGASGEDAYDDAKVGAPCAIAGETELGRPVLRLYYQAESAAGVRTIGLAGRFEDGPFDHGASPVFGAGSSRAPSEPAVIVFDGITFLFATQHKSGTSDSPAIAAGVAPANAELPPVAASD